MRVRKNNSTDNIVILFFPYLMRHVMWAEIAIQ